MTGSQNFDNNMAKWKDWQNSPWGRLRYIQAAKNLAKHLPKTPLKILDIGGGNGVEALTLAEAGHEVTLVDYAAEMVNEARQNAQESGLSARMHFYQAEVATILKLFPEPLFDLVICHNLLQYVQDIPETLNILNQLLKTTGLISVMSINRYSEVYVTTLREQDPTAARLNFNQTQSLTTLFGMTVRKLSGAEIITQLENAGFKVEGHYGVRSVSDYIIDNEIKKDPTFFAALEELEETLSSEYPYYLLARLFQIMARKL